ncbi:MAG: agmatinase family protein [Actinomycetes bacterium]|jgi:formiminoglutamase|nr:MAG: formimidoylglutamase [Actinomycetota bacterium]
MAIVDPHWPRADVWLAREHHDPVLTVVGVPSSKASLSPSRADMAPLVMRERLGRFSTFHGETGVDFGSLPVRDVGNWPVSELTMEEIPVEVRRLAERLDRGVLTLYLGGDNAITRPLVAALGDPERVGVLTFDAHHDVRSLERGPTNGTPIRGLIEEEGLPGSNVVQVGLHSFANSAAYRAWCGEQGIGVFTMADVDARGIDAVVEDALSRLSHCERIYVDVDVDVLDSAFAPGCPGARPGGMTVRDLSRAVHRCAAHPAVVAMDFVEVDPERDPSGRTVDVMAHLFLTAAAGLAQRLG